MLAHIFERAQEELANLFWKYGEIIGFLILVLLAELLFSSSTHRQSDRAADAAEYSQMKLENSFRP